MINPDVGRTFGSTGFLDLYVNNDLKWGIELVRDGFKLQEHFNRFDAGGIYKKIPFHRWIVLDFYHGRKYDEIKNHHQGNKNYWQVLYFGEYLNLKYQNETEELIEFLNLD